MTFLPKPFIDQAGNGCHINVSLWQHGKNICHLLHSDEHSVAAHFIEGLLHHIDTLCAITLPSYLSYERIQANAWSGAYAVWGYNNKEAVIRVPVLDQSAERFEIKCADAMINPYLAFAMLMACGFDGINQQRHLRAAVQQNPAHIEACQHDRLPQDLQDSLTALENNQTIAAIIDNDQWLKAYLAVKRADYQLFAELDMTSCYDWLKEIF